MSRTQRRRLIIVSNVTTPYRVHLHQRIAAEVPELQLRSVFLGESTHLRWRLELPPEIDAWLAPGRPGRPGAPFSLVQAWRDWKRGALVWDALGSPSRIAAIVLNGYAEATMFRLADLAMLNGVPVLLRGDANVRTKRPGGANKRWIKQQLLTWLFRRCSGFLTMGELGDEYFKQYGAKPEQCFRVPYEPDYRGLIEQAAVEPEAPAEEGEADSPTATASHGQAVSDLFAAKRQAIQRVEEEEEHEAEVTALPALETISEWYDPDKRRLLYVGRLVQRKGVDLLLRAFGRIAAERPDWELVLAGDGVLREALQRMVPANVRSRTHWVGFQEQADLARVYSRCDALVLPSRVEPWGVVVNEAMCLGLPVVASDVVGSAHELVRPYSCGAIFRAGDIDDLTAKLRTVTDEAGYLAAKRNVSLSLAEWRRRCDPVVGLRAALAAVKALPAVEPPKPDPTGLNRLLEGGVTDGSHDPGPHQGSSEGGVDA